MLSHDTRSSAPTALPFELLARAVSLASPMDALACPECRDALDLHQPDENQPAHLLGTCASCGNWYFLVELEADWRRAVLFDLPSVAAIRQMFNSPGTDSCAEEERTVANGVAYH
jgi:hypothetical protein